MTAHQALSQVENRLMLLGLQQDGEPLLAAEAAGVVGAYIGDSWSRIEDAFERGEISPDGYTIAMYGLIEQFSRDKRTKEFDSFFAGLKRDQIELDVMRGTA